MAGAKRSVEEVLADLPIPILPNIGREPTREALIYLHKSISGNAVPVALNLGGGRHRYLVLTMKAGEYMAQMGYAFFPPHTPGNYPPMMGTAQ